MSVNKITGLALAICSLAWCQSLQIQGTQQRGEGKNGTLQSQPVKLSYGAVIARAECDGDGFWIEGPGGIVRFRKSSQAVNYRLSRGIYRVFPNLKPGQSRASVCLFLQGGATGREQAPVTGKSLFDGSWPGTVRQHTDCSYRATTEVSITTDAQGITSIVAADGAFGQARGKVVGRTLTFQCGIKDGVASGNGAITLSEDGLHFSGNFSDNTGHRGTLQGNRQP